MSTRYRFNRFKPWRRGITLVESLVVVFVLALLFSLIGPATQISRDAARSMSCESNLRQISLAIQNHESRLRRFPISDLRADSASHPVRGALYSLLSDLELRIPEPDQSPYSIGNRNLAANCPIVLICPSEKMPPQGAGTLTYSLHSAETFLGQFGISSYATNAGVPPFIRKVNRGPIATRLRRDIVIRASSVTDGLSNTLGAWESSRTQACFSMNGMRFCRKWDEFLGNSQSELETYDTYGEKMTVREADYLSFLIGWTGSSAGSILPIDKESGGVAERNTEIAKVVNMTNLSRGPFSWHSGYANIGFLDGHTQRLSNNIDFRLGSALAGMADQVTLTLAE